MRHFDLLSVIQVFKIKQLLKYLLEQFMDLSNKTGSWLSGSFQSFDGSDFVDFTFFSIEFPFRQQKREKHGTSRSQESINLAAIGIVSNKQ